jgi:hypothetical protein
MFMLLIISSIERPEGDGLATSVTSVACPVEESGLCEVLASPEQLDINAITRWTEIPATSLFFISAP